MKTRTFRPQITSQELLRKGTDFQFEGRFQETLAYNHFRQEDFKRLGEVAAYLEESFHEAIQLLHSQFVELRTGNNEPPSLETVEAYIRTFFFEERTQAYVDKTMVFFNQLRKNNYHIGKLLVAFNQLNFFFTIKLLSKKALSPHTCLRLMESLQRAMNIEQEVLIEVYTEKLMEDTAVGITSIMEKNAEIMFIRDLLKKMEEQSEEAQTISASTEEMTASIAEVASNAVSVAERTEDAVKKAEQGRMVITAALDEIVLTDKTFQQIVEHFDRLKQDISRIQDVVQLIHGIADQTNLLALNASIEAARAGEHGRGFAVVASEVRKLAENTVESLKEVNKNVNNLETFSQEMSESINLTTNIIQQGVHKASEAVPILEEIVTDVERISAATTSTAASAQEQAAAVDDVAQRMVQITDLSEQVKALGNNTGVAVHDLGKLTEALRNMLFSKNIHLSTRSMLLLSKTDHILWKWRIYNMLLGFEQVRPEDVLSHKECRLGKWYFDASTSKRLSTYEDYQLLDEPHHQVHQYAKQAAEAYARRDMQDAEKQLALLDQASKQVLNHIDRLLHLLEQSRA